MDGILHSLEDDKSTRELFNNAIDICRAGRYRSEELTWNKKELLLSIPKNKWGIVMKDQDLSGQPPNKKSLNICWKIGNATSKQRRGKDLWLRERYCQ